ncbi:MAG TPA: M56 family metallopeptidase [Puia sp.]|jgi:beta-lactamase regulating signal transducer with metallopeptidase domain
MIQAICWTLVHSLWQGLLFALVAGVVLLLTRQASAAVRYNIVCILFFSFLAVCGATFLYEWAGVPAEDGTSVAAARGASRMAAWIDALGRFCSDHAVPIVWGWLFVFSIRALHMVGGYLYAQRVRHYGISPAPGDWQEKVNKMSQQMGIRRAVRLVESHVVKMPLVIGHLRPMIFMPLGLVTGLPAGEIEAVLLHELAHIRRNDYVVNFIQNVAANVFFFNPGLLWLSSLLREERENCCDDMAIARTRNRAEFIRALISFKEHDLRLARISNAFPGKKDQLVKRAMRIAQSTNKTLDPVEKIFLAVSLVLITLLVAATSGNSSTSPIKTAQIPGGRYRFFVDTPSGNMLAGLAEHPQKTAAELHNADDHQEARNREDHQEARNREDHQEARNAEAHQDAHNAVNQPETGDMPEPTPAEASAMDETQKIESVAAKGNVVMVKKMVIDAREAMDNDAQAYREDQQALIDKKIAEEEAQQALRDKWQADRDLQQTKMDAEQAMRDKVQQRLDIEQASRDREQTVRDGEQSVRDHGRTVRDREQTILKKKPISP